jgi:hypothetical protein
MKKFLRSKFVRAVLFLIAFVVTGIVLAYSVTSYLGRREWAATRKALEARGEKLSIEDFVPPPLADELNFFSMPAFAELADYELVKREGWVTTTEPRVPTDEQQLNVVKKALGSSFQKAKRLPNELTNLAAIAAYYQSEGQIEEGNRPPAEVVLEALKPAQPLLEEIALYAERPGARFPVRYEDGIAATMPHVGHIISLSRFLSLRAVAEMEAGDGAAALKDVLLMLRLSDTLRTEPTLIALLVRISALGTANQAIWEGIARGVWNDEQLATLQERLGAYDLYPDIANAFRTERAWMLTIMENTLLNGNLSTLLNLVDMAGQSKQPRDNLSVMSVAYLYPRGWIYSDLAFLSNTHQRWIDEIDKRQEGLRPKNYQFLESEMAQWDFPTKIKHLISSLALPSIVSVVNKGAAAQTGLDEARVALAIERYRLAHGEVPETLEALVPQFLKSVPLDIMTAKPLSYRRLSPDDFLLWSIGWDEVDDNGTPLDQRTKKGDIVWMRLPASAKSQ